MLMLFNLLFPIFIIYILIYVAIIIIYVPLIKLDLINGKMFKHIFTLNLSHQRTCYEIMNYFLNS